MIDPRRLTRVGLVLMLAGAGPVVAEPEVRTDADRAEMGRQIMLGMYRYPEGSDRVSRDRMELRQAGGEVRTRVLYTYIARSRTGATRSLIRFVEPGNIAGTGLLSIESDDGTINQWVYLPTLKSVRRIPVARQGGRFAGSDFFYEDLAAPSIVRDAHRWLDTVQMRGRQVEIVESTPEASRASVYARQVFWIDTDLGIPLQVDFYFPGRADPGKRFEALAFDETGGYLAVVDARMSDLVGNHQTRLITEQIQYDQGLPDRLFSTRSLEDEQLEMRFRPSN